MTYQKIARTDELKNGEKKRVVLGSKVLLLVRLDGSFYALDNRCPHMGGSLADGALDGGNIVCPRHGMTFDARTGEAVKNGRMAFVPVKAGSARAYPVRVEGGDVLVGLE